MYSIIMLSILILSNLDNIPGRTLNKIIYDVIQLSGGGQRIQIRRGLCRRISSIIFCSWAVLGVALVLMP